MHTPLQAKAEIIEKYKSKLRPGQAQNNPIYAAMIQSVDEAVGRVLETLEELNLSDRTVVVFTSDNGGLARVTSVAPLRAGKGSAYEGGVRVPLIIRWLGVVESGSECHVPVISPDFFPTILEISGVEPPSTDEIDGISLMPLLKQTGFIDRDAIFFHHPHYHSGGATPFGAVR